jgi:RNA polymerase sigma-70 factor (ECF subfamily)
MESPGGWVHRTALNVARRRLRREKLEGRLMRRAAAGVPAEAPPPTWPFELWDALRRLTPREREAMVLRHVADLSTADVAAVMGVSTGTVTSTLSTARARMATEHSEEVSDA